MNERFAVEFSRPNDMVVLVIMDLEKNECVVEDKDYATIEDNIFETCLRLNKLGWLFKEACR